MVAYRTGRKIIGKQPELRSFGVGSKQALDVLYAGIQHRFIFVYLVAGAERIVQINIHKGLLQCFFGGGNIRLGKSENQKRKAEQPACKDQQVFEPLPVFLLVFDLVKEGSIGKIDFFYFSEMEKMNKNGDDQYR